MRTQRRLRLQLRKHLIPFLNFLNGGRVQSKTEFVTGVDRIIDDVLADTKAESQNRRAWILEKAVWRKLYGLHQLRFGISSGATFRPFFDEAKERQITFEQLCRGWLIFWRFLQAEFPDIQHRINRCAWCTRFFFKYRRRDTHCSSLCGLVDRTLLNVKVMKAAAVTHRIAARGQELLDRLETDRLKRVGTQKLWRNNEALFALITDPVTKVIRPRGRFSFPNDVNDVTTFVFFWDFVFGRHFTALKNRFGTCEWCDKFYIRYRPTSRTCSRRCQLSLFRTRRTERRAKSRRQALARKRR